MPKMSQGLRERAIGLLTAGMSTRAVAASNIVLENLAVRPAGLTTTDDMYGYDN